MLTNIQPSVIKGTIQAPTSKSSMQRACAAALLKGGETIIHNPGNSNDDQAALGVIRALGAQVEILEDGSLKVSSDYASVKKGQVPGQEGGHSFVKGNTHTPVAREVNCGESGLGIRMFAPIIALNDQLITVNGEGSLLTRPMDFFDEIFPLLGIRVTSNHGRLPLQIQGPLKPRSIEIDGSLSSQFLTGLLMSFAAAGAADVSIRVNNLKSKPYIDLTLQVMRHFGWQVENRNYEEFYFPAGSSQADPGTAGAGSANAGGSLVETYNYTVEGDWSGGAFLLVAGAVSGRITIKGLDIQSTQADKAILQALSDCGAGLSIRDREIEIGPGVLKAFHFNATDCPDLFPPLVALASFCAGTTVIEGVGRLAHKESNRALTLQEEFGKMGIDIELQGDLMLIKGGNGVKGATVHSRHDHRIAMACAVAALQAEGGTIIEEAQAINKSYPDFYTHLQHLGAVVSIREEAGNVH